MERITLELLQKNLKYPGKFSIQNDSLKDVFFDAQIYLGEENTFEMEISYSSPVIETVELTNYIEHTFQFYDIQGMLFIGNKKHEVSLLRCSLNKTNWCESFDSKDQRKNFSNHYVKIHIGAYILDAKIGSTSHLSKANFKFSALSMWADMLNGDVLNNNLTIPYKKEWKTTADTGDELVIKNYLEENKRNTQTSYIQTAELDIVFAKVKTFEEYLEYGRIYNDFFVLMTGRKSDIESFAFTLQDTNREYKVLVNYRTCHPKFSEQSYFHFGFLTQNLYSLKHWFSYYKNTNLAYALFFDTIHFKERYMTDMLLDAYLRSFEGMITKFYFENEYFISGNKNKQIVKSIKESITSQIDVILEQYSLEQYKIDNYLDKYKKTVLEAFTHSYELSFRTRINLFFDLHKNYFEDDFKNYKKDEIVHQMIQFRNAYAHADDSKLNIENIFTLIRFIKKMILVHLYSDILQITTYEIDLAKIL